MIALEAEKFTATPPEQDWSELGLRPDPNWSRWWQVAIAAVGLLLLTPLALVIAIATKLTSRGPVLYSGTRIGRNCYIASGTTVMNGLTVGDGALVGLASAVIRDVPPASKVAGHPARVLEVAAAPPQKGA